MSLSVILTIKPLSAEMTRKMFHANVHRANVTLNALFAPLCRKIAILADPAMMLGLVVARINVNVGLRV